MDTKKYNRDSFFMTMIFDWNEEKNEMLKEERNISFEEVVLALQDEKNFSIALHPNPLKYPNQKIYIISLHQYTYMVPFVDHNEIRFLKTIIPSRKLHKSFS